jgi:hypothetical protein
MSTRLPNQDRIALMSTAMASLLVIALVTWANSPPATVPAQLEPGPSEAPAMTVAAKGVQIYECRNRKDAAGYEWVFVAPEAELFDARGQMVGRHGAGPSWEASDGSKIVGTVRERVDAPIAGAIPWLLLATRSVGPEGSFSKVTSVQRVNTVGGVAPKADCNADTIGTMARIAYTADYRFFTVR